MKKINLTEEELTRIVSDSVHKYLIQEGFSNLKNIGGPLSAAADAAATAIKNQAQQGKIQNLEKVLNNQIVQMFRIITNLIRIAPNNQLYKRISLSLGAIQKTLATASQTNNQQIGTAATTTPGPRMV